MLKIKKSEIADTRTCDFSKVSKDELLEASHEHIGDVSQALGLFRAMLELSSGEHDFDKLTEIDHFHSDFKGGFEETGWWDNHRRINRHHIDKEDGIPSDVNLIDVLEHIADCVMAGMVRSGKVYDIELPDELLQRAVKNTVELLKNQVEVEDE